MITKLSINISVLLCIFLLQGCAGTVNSFVKESDKDPNASFDGRYLAVVNHPGGRQEFDTGWYSNCGPEVFEAGFIVRDSQVQFPFDQDTVLSGYVDKAGRFRLEHLLESEATSSSTIMSDGTAKFILQGVISGDVMKGMLVFGIAQFNFRGCSYPVEYRFLESGI